MFYRHGLCIVTLALLFIYFKSHNQSNNETKVQISEEPHLKVPILEIRTTPNCAEIKNLNYSEDEKLYILLLSQRKELNHAKIIQIISTNEESSHSLITTSNSSSVICGLSHNKTYFLYSFVESSIAGGKSSIELQAIHTKSLETIWKPLLPSSNTFFTILFPALSLCFVFLYCLYGRTKSKKNCLINHYNNPADKIIKEWKLVTY